MPHFDQEYEYKPLPEYPHMGPEDSKIWEDFIRGNPDRFIACWYDVRVGEAAEILPEQDRTYETAWWDLTRWRVDVIAEDRDKIYIIELKPYANAKALGQALAYAALYLDNYQPQKAVVPVVITDRAHLTTIQAAKAMGVELWDSDGNLYS